MKSDFKDFLDTPLEQKSDSILAQSRRHIGQSYEFVAPHLQEILKKNRPCTQLTQQTTIASPRDKKSIRDSKVKGIYCCASPFLAQ